VDEEDLERTQYVPGSAGGHYESFFIRANHPERPLAFWIRYTLFSPRGKPADAIGELWAVWFDGETREHTVAKNEIDLRRCDFSRTEVRVDIGSTILDAHHARGSIGDGARALSWELAYSCEQRPLLLLPERLYDAPLPRAKSLVPGPMTRFRGTVGIGNKHVDITDWVGSRNHNWGSRHTDSYAWGQVAGFDSHRNAFLEVATARLKLGPWMTPPATLLVLRLAEREHRLNDLRRAFRAAARIDGFEWVFACEAPDVSVRGRIAADRDAFVGLRYANPPGGEKHCLNSKIAACELHVTDKASGITEVLSTQNRAAFEILTDRRDHGILIRA
jgi:hypothetical protein